MMTIIFFVSFFLSVLALPTRVLAAEKNPETIILQPTYQDVTLEEASRSAKTKITVKNQTKSEQQFSVFAVDISQIDADGNVVLSNKPIVGGDFALANFLTMEPSILALKPDESKDVTVTIRNLQDLSPGGHYAAVVVRSVPFTLPTDKQTILPALSSFLLVRKKGGERYHISLKSISESERLMWWKLPEKLTLLFENQGNVHTAPRGEIKVRDLFHREVIEGTINEGSKIVLPQSQREIPVYLRQIRRTFPVMLYNVQIAGRSDPGDVPFEQSFTLLFISPVAIGIILGVVGVLIVLWKWRMKWRKKLSKILKK